MDKESVLQKRNRAEHSSLLIVSAGFLLLCTCEVFGIITGKLWIGQREIVFGGTLFFIMFLSQFALNLKYYLIDKKKWRIAEGIDRLQSRNAPLNTSGDVLIQLII